MGEELCHDHNSMIEIACERELNKESCVHIFSSL